MGRLFKTAATLTAAAVSRSNRKKTLRNVRKINEANRNLTRIGRVSADQLIPCYSQIGNICITGSDQDIRNKLLVQSVLQSASLGLPTIVLHEGNYRLVSALVHTCANYPYFRVINNANPFYDPILRLSDAETASLIVESSPQNNKIDAAGALYLRALSLLLRKRGVTPYLRMLASCPHNALQAIVLQEEQSGRLSAAEATSIRNDIQAGTSARANIEFFFSQLQAETSIVAWKSHLSRSTSIQECIKAGGIITIDIDSTAKKTQLAVITTEIEQCMSKGLPFRIVLDVTSLAGSERLASVLKNSSGTMCWTFSTPDIGAASGTAADATSAWLALSHKTIIFAHSVHSAELLSKELGEYEHIEVTQAHTGNNSIGQFGLHFGASNNVSTTNKRERVVKQEDISGLGYNEFIMLDNNTAGLFWGILT